MPPTAAALLVAAALAFLAAASALWQVRGMRALAARDHVPSDERAYLRSRHRRRLLASGLMAAVGGLIGGTYLSGLEDKADALGEPDPFAPRDADGKRQMTPAERATVRTWGGFWVAAVGLTLAFLVVALFDAIATRRYWAGVYRQLKDDHQTKLRRDLAVYRAQKAQRGGRPGYGGRLGS